MFDLCLNIIIAEDIKTGNKYSCPLTSDIITYKISPDKVALAGVFVYKKIKSEATIQIMAFCGWGWYF